MNRAIAAGDLTTARALHGAIAGLLGAATLERQAGGEVVELDKARARRGP